MQRLTYKVDNLNMPGHGSFMKALIFTKDDGRGTPCKISDGANLISSRLPNGNHAPVLDIDVPHRVVSSTTPGHSHLYLDVETTWPRYVLLLLALRLNGIIEKGHCYWSIRRGATFVRLPWIRKR